MAGMLQSCGMVSVSYLADHHVAIERSLAICFFRPVYVGSDCGDYRMAEGDIWYLLDVSPWVVQGRFSGRTCEVSIHDIDMKPIGSSFDCVRAFFA